MKIDEKEILGTFEKRDGFLEGSLKMLTKEGLLNLLDKIKEAVECGSEFGILRYELYEGEYIIHSEIRAFDELFPDEEVRITAL